jgi:hypothetical protein
MSMSELNVQVHAECLCPSCMSMTILHVFSMLHFHVLMLHVNTVPMLHVYAECSCLHVACRCPLSMLHVHGGCPCCISSPTCSCCMSTSTCSCCMYMLNVHNACPWCLSTSTLLVHLHVNSECHAADPCCMPMEHVQTACPWCFSTLLVYLHVILHANAADLCWIPMEHDRVHVHASCPFINVLLCFYNKMGEKLFPSHIKKA